MKLLSFDFPQPFLSHVFFIQLATKQTRLKLQRYTRQIEFYKLYMFNDTCSCKHCRRVLIRQHKAQMKRKSKEIQEALVRSDCIGHVIVGPQCVHDTGPITILRSEHRVHQVIQFQAFFCTDQLVISSICNSLNCRRTQRKLRKPKQ